MDCPKHIQNHHLSWLNIQLNDHVLPQPPSPPPTHHLSTQSRSPPQDQDVHQQPVAEPEMPELIDDDEDDEEDMNPPDKSPSPDPDVHTLDHGTPPPPPFSDSTPKAQPGVSCIFHPTINGTL